MSPRPFRPRARPMPPRRRQARALEQQRLGSFTPSSADPNVAALPDVKRTVELPANLTVKELSDILGVTPVVVIKELMKNGIIANINQTIDRDTATVVATDLGADVREPAAASGNGLVGVETEAAEVVQPQDDPALLKPRPPVITVLGHVDHGKTSLLDAIRQTRVAHGEVGGITQHIGAYQVDLSGHRMTFLDTPGHQAFTAMRARGAQATDIAVLVVAADDGVMPQTKEAIDHARAAQVPIVVALNKIDKADAEPDRVKQQLAGAGVVVREYGGDVELVAVSAKTGEGLENLLETIWLVSEADVEPRANPDRPAAGVVLEARRDKARGPVATVLVQNGTLHGGDAVVCGSVAGKVKALFNERGKLVKHAGPGAPVEILGLEGVPTAGERMLVVQDEKRARALVEASRSALQREAGRSEMSLEELFGRMQSGQIKELPVVVKTDVQGSIEPILASLEQLGQEGLRIRALLSGTGNVTESDVMLASASKAIIIAFNVRLEPGARKAAEAQRVEVRSYQVIYNLVDDISKALNGLLEPTYHEVVQGHAEVRQVFKLRKAAAAGCMVTDGVIPRNSLVRVRRGPAVLFQGKLSSLRRVKDDVREVSAGYECGMVVEGFHDFEEGDVIEAYVTEQQAA